jgi:predicted negative regulator of RcsB-dependent stress response
LAILTGLVIAALIIAAVYVGYHAYEASLHEEIKTHSISLDIQTIQSEITQIFSYTKPDLAGVIL